jgi:hypothetical protein
MVVYWLCRDSEGEFLYKNKFIRLGIKQEGKSYIIMEQRNLKNLNNCLNTSIYSYLETSGVQSSKLYLNVQSFNTSVD